MTCPSELKLEAFLLDEARSPLAPHVLGCEQCQARLARMKREGDDFNTYVYAQTVDGLTAPRRKSWAWLAAPVFALGAFAAFFLVVQRPSDDYVGGKGSALKLTVYAGLPSGAKELSDGDAVPADASLRFRVQTSQPCRLLIASVDESGMISQLFADEVSGAQTLPGGAVLDGHAGPERIYATCNLTFSQVHTLVREAARGPREAARLEGAPRGALQTSLLVEKR